MKTRPRGRVATGWLSGVIAGLLTAGVQAAEDLDAIVTDMKPGQWQELQDTRLEDVFPEKEDHPHWAQMGPKAVTRAWSGGAYDTKRNRFYLKGGGHGAYGGNEVYQFDLEAMRWERVTEPSEHEQDPEFADRSESSQYFRTADDTPVSRHTYDGMVYLPNVDKVLMWGGSLYSIGNDYDHHAWLFDPETYEWTRGAETKSSNIETVSAYDPETGQAIFEYGYGIYGYDPEADEWQVIDGRNNSEQGRVAEVDPKRRLFIEAFNPNDDTPITYFDLENRSGRQKPDLTGDTDFVGTPTPGMAYHEPTGYMVLWKGYGEVWVLDPDSWEVRKLEPRPGAMPDHIGTDSYPVRGKYKTWGIYGRWAYVPDYDVFIGYGHTEDNVWLYRLPDDPFDWEPPTQEELVEAGEIAECDADFCVGPDFQYDTPSEVAKQIKEGDTVAIQGGEYEDCARWPHSVTIRGIDGRPRIGNKVCGGKAVWITQGDETVIENVELYGGSDGGRNGEGIRHEGRHLVVRDSEFHSHRMGILTNHKEEIELEVYNSEFHDMRSHSGLAHQLYAGQIKRLVVEGSYFHEGDVGHQIKSVAAENEIRYNYLRNRDGAEAALMDLWGCSDSEIIGNVMAYAGDTGALQAISLTHRNRRGKRLECDREPDALIAYNTAVFTGDDRRWSSFVRNKFGVEYTIANNLVVNTRDLEFRKTETGLGELVANVHLKERALELFADVKEDDFHLTNGLKERANQIDRVPDKAYRHPVATEARDGGETPGAYEHGE